MFKFKKTIREFFDEDSVETQIKKLGQSLWRTIFSLAIATKITPKSLAVVFDEAKLTEYAQKFHDELGKKEKQLREKTKKDLSIK